MWQILADTKPSLTQPSIRSSARPSHPHQPKPTTAQVVALRFRRRARPPHLLPAPENRWHSTTPDHGLSMDAAAAALPNPSLSPGGGGGGEGEKAAIAAHPLYARLLEAHVTCLHVATPIDQLPSIDAQIAARPPPLATAAAACGPSGGEELDLFMAHYVLLLCSFKEQLQQHVRVHAMEAVMGCWELEQSLQWKQ